jgi:hypothetical protein
LKIYDDIGFRFQLLRSLLANAHLIALPARRNGQNGEEAVRPAAPFSWEEFMKMLDEIREEAEKFLGREIERPKSQLFKNFAAFYHRLCELGTPVHLKNPNYDLGAALIDTKKEMPELKDFNAVSFRLNLDDREETIFRAAIRKFAHLLAAAKNGNAVTPEQICEVTAELAKLECLRRVGTPDQKGPLDEYKNLINYINTWKKSFEAISGIINEKTTEVFRTMAVTISQSLPAPPRCNRAPRPSLQKTHRNIKRHRRSLPPKPDQENRFPDRNYFKLSGFFMEHARNR